MCNTIQELDKKTQRELKKIEGSLSDLKQKMEDPDYLVQAHQAAYNEAMKHAHPSPETLKLIADLKKTAEATTDMIVKHLENESTFSREMVDAVVEMKQLATEVRTWRKETQPVTDFFQQAQTVGKINKAFFKWLIAVAAGITTLLGAVYGIYQLIKSLRW